MTLAPLSLDDLTYDDLRQMAVRRIPAASGGRWTHHEPVDAGVTLLELFAFLLEQQLFVLDQVPDSLTHAILALLGEQPDAAGIARTGVAPPDGAVDAAMVLATGTVLHPAGGGLGAMAFSTEADTLLLPVQTTSIFADGVEVGDRIGRGEAVPVLALPTGSLAVEAALSVPVSGGEVGAQMAVAVILSDYGVAAEWEDGASDVPPPATLRLDWETEAASGTLTDWEDGTGGLRRSGLIRFALPAETVGASRFRLTLSGDADAFAVPPLVRRVAFGATIAAHRRRVELRDGMADATLQALYADLAGRVAALLPNSGQVLDLPGDLSPVIGPSINLSMSDRDGVFQDWQIVPDLTSAAPDARVYAFDRLRNRLTFGDGYAGRVPAPAQDIRLSVDIGGGVEGNHAADMEWQPMGDLPVMVSLADAKGGAEAETLEQARARVASALAARNRAVTKEDYINLTGTTPGIAGHRAHVAAGHEPGFACIKIADSVTIFVVPHSDEAHAAPRADEGALTAIRDRLDAARMLTTRVFVARPAIRPVAVTLDVTAATGTREGYAALLRPVLSNYLHPTLGGALATGWPFGGPLRPSELLRVADGALGDDARVQRVALRLTDVPGGREEDCSELHIGPNDLVRLDALRVNLSVAARAEVTL